MATLPIDSVDRAAYSPTNETCSRAGSEPKPWDPPSLIPKYESAFPMVAKVHTRLLNRQLYASLREMFTHLPPLLDDDQIEEAYSCIQRAGLWGMRNLIKSFLEQFDGLNGNIRLGKKERALMREVAEAKSGAVFAPQINPAWSRDHMDLSRTI